MTDMTSNLYGNPHSASSSSQLSTQRIEDIRLKVSRFFKADPKYFDVVFVANATAGIKLVAEAFRELDGGFSYIYHRDAHTSLVGARESAVANHCLDDEGIEEWLHYDDGLYNTTPTLFAYPAQSNLDGRRLPLSWIKRSRYIRSQGIPTVYTLLDASAFVSTAQLDLSDVSAAPDFTVLSFYKIFGFPDLGALIVKKDTGRILQKRKYFGGGTVDVVLSVKEQWHVLKEHSLHESLEDGTLAFHSILALGAAIDMHNKLFESMDRIAKHTAFLSQRLYDGLASLRHANSQQVCMLHSRGFASEKTRDMQGPIIAFNVRNRHGAWVSNTEFEKLATVRKFHIRSGGLCNPGGVAASLNLEPWEMRQNFSAGFRCGVESDIYAGKITGILRASVGAMSTIQDVDAFVSFVDEFYTEKKPSSPASYPLLDPLGTPQTPVDMFVESLTIYPIKSCGGFSIAPDTHWEVRPEGLRWDREWCLVHQGTGQALNQKRHPRMALIRPSIDFHEGVLRVEYRGGQPSHEPNWISIPLSSNPAFCKAKEDKFLSSRVCGDNILAQTYTDEINEFFSRILEIPCALARFPAGGSSPRHAKPHMQKYLSRSNDKTVVETLSRTYSPPTPPDSDNETQRRPLLLSNESPILVINRASLSSLNDIIAKTGGKQASASVFRANIVVSSTDQNDELAYGEDNWSSMQIGQQMFQMLGSCRRCHMICIDQETAQKDEEPFVTLAKTRRFESKVFFGSHVCHIAQRNGTKASQHPTIKVGDIIRVSAVESDRLLSSAS